MKSLGIFKDYSDGSIKCVFDVNGNNDIIEMTLLIKSENKQTAKSPLF